MNTDVVVRGAIGAWRVERPLGNAPEAARHALVGDAGATAEARVLRPAAALWPGARAAWAAPARIDDPAALPVLETNVYDNLPVRVVPPLSGGVGGLTAAEAVAVGRWLAPAVLAGAGACGGELRPSDLVVDAEGVPRFLPQGVAPPEPLGRPSPHRAPERRAVREGVPLPPVDGAADLWGLGVTLWSAVKGAPPWSASNLTDLLARQAAPLPSLDDDAADALFAALLSLDPAARVGVVTSGDRGAPPKVAAAADPTPPTVTTPARAAPSPTWAGPGFPRYVVLVRPATLSTMARSRLASQTGVSPTAIVAAAQQGLSLAAGGADVEVDARVLARSLAASGVPAEVDTTVPPKVVHYLAVAIIAVIVGFVSGYILIFGLIAAALVYMTVVNFRVMFQTAAVRFAWQQYMRAVAAEDDSPERRIARARARAAALPAPASAAALSRVDEAEGALAELRAAGDPHPDGPATDVERALSETEADVTRALGEVAGADGSDEPHRVGT